MAPRFRARYRLSLLLLVLLALAGGLRWAVSPTMALEVRAGEEGPVVKSFPVSTGEQIVYSYRHSIQTTRVDEILEVTSAGHLTVREAFYDMTGVGLPADPDGDLSLDPITHRYHVTNMSRDISPWRVRVGSVCEQTLEVGSQVVRLDSLAPATTLLVVQPVSEAWGAQLLGH